MSVAGSFRIEVTEKKTINMPHKHNHLFLSHCEAIHLRASILINITNCVLKQNDFWANSLPYAYRHVTRKHHVCGGNTEGDWTCIHLGE